MGQKLRLNALVLIAMAGPNVALGACPPLLPGWDVPAATRLEELSCASGIVRIARSSLVRLARPEFGAIEISVVQISADNENAAGVQIEVGPHGQYASRNNYFLDRTEIPGLADFLNEAMIYASRPMTNAADTSVLSWNAKAQFHLSASAGRLGSISFVVGRIGDSHKTIFVLTPDETRLLQQSFLSARNTLSRSGR